MQRPTKKFASSSPTEASAATAAPTSSSSSSEAKKDNGAAAPTAIAPACAAAKKSAAATPASAAPTRAAAGPAPTRRANEWLEASAWELEIRRQFPEVKRLVISEKIRGKTREGAQKVEFEVVDGFGHAIGTYMALRRGDAHEKTTISTNPMLRYPSYQSSKEMADAFLKAKKEQNADAFDLSDWM